ncbi:MAG: phasin family protein [Gammaproteobacteria bacterium]|nr:phasin family protein [Gammaproteobacteria bacterium]
MQNDIFEQFVNAGKTSYENLQQLGTINTKALQKLTELQFSLATIGIEGSVEQAKLLSSTTNYKDLVAAESDLANQYSSKVMDISKQTADVLNESGEEIASWFEKTAESFADTAKPAQKKTITAAATKKAA